MQLIDLSVPITRSTPVFPCDPPVEVEKIFSIEKDGVNVSQISLGTHAATHIDAPSHMIEGGKVLSQFPLETFYGHAVCMNVLHGFYLDAIKKIRILESDIVLFYTGLTDAFNFPYYFTKHPVIPEEVAQYLIDKKVKMVGMDMSGPDYDPYPIHKLFLQNNILIIENLTNLHFLEGKECTVMAFPIRLKVDGAPVRVVAELKG